MSLFSKTLLLTGAGMALVGLSAGVASAKIGCRDSFQVVSGQLIATPYCEDEYLAKVAREYGMRVSASAVRNSPSVKGQVCHTIGHDPRAQSACASYRHDGFRIRRF